MAPVHPIKGTQYCHHRPCCPFFSDYFHILHFLKRGIYSSVGGICALQAS